MKIFEVRDILKATVLVGEDLLDKSVSGGGAADLMGDVLSTVAKDAILLTGLTTDKVLETARVSGLGAVVFVRGKKPDKKFLEMARTHDIPILLTDHSLFVACGKLYIGGLRGLDGSW
ncbi:MAG: hypothetical protein GY859_20130 [Desulfobacterales bacterium]|nr:hypothetical protein [Desulfobacterales bacterium]